MLATHRLNARLVGILLSFLLALAAAWTASSGHLRLRSAPPAHASGEVLIYLPFAARSPADVVSVSSVEVLDQAGVKQLAFERSVPVTHRVSGVVIGFDPVTVSLEITESGLCGAGNVFDDAIELEPGPWHLDLPLTSPDCPGIYAASVVVVQDDFVDALAGQYVVNDPFTQVLTTDQGFDRCVPPTVGQMAAWWAESPYSSVNIYLGGIHYPSFCQTGIQNAIWVHQVAAQGWTFTATWVGPQPPCSNFTHRFSSNLATAYDEGKEEAASAAAKARVLGMFGEITIQYDIEGYWSNSNDSCRNAVQSFLQGWTDQLHTLGLQAGAYGGGCSSFVTDWSENDPVVDQVWIAHWQLPAGYDPEAEVWNAACVSNSLWADHERIKQYSGDHVETWGGASMTVDSNVFDTEAIGWGAEIPAPAIVDFGPLGQAGGWAQVGGRLFRTADLGEHWEEITPAGFTVLGAAFQDSQTGYAAGLPDGAEDLHFAATADGGGTWSLAPIGPAAGLAPFEIGRVHLEILDGAHIWAAVKLVSGSSFSLGQLYASADGGATWEMRSLPLGEPVAFETPLLGWTAGGPAGVSAFQTQDGGLTWSVAALSEVPDRLTPDGGYPPGALPPGAVLVSSPEGDIAWALVQSGSCGGDKAAQSCRLIEELHVTVDGGLHWIVIPGPDPD